MSSDRPATVTAASRAPASTRRARLVLTRIDPWSVLKFTLLLSVALLIVVFVAVAVLYTVLDSSGVFTSVDETLQAISPSLSTADYIGLSRVLGATLFIGAVNVVLITALSTVGAFLYNLCAGLVGGVEVTLSEGS